MTAKEAEVTKTEAAMIAATKSYQDALADHAEEIKAAELPEVWYEDSEGCLWHFREGVSGVCDFAGSDVVCVSTRDREYIVANFGAKIITQAEHDNARALYHGADFTGKLDQIVDTPICELNKATRDEMLALLFNQCEARNIIEGGGWFDLYTPNGGTLEDNLVDSNYREYAYRLRAPKTRPMTRKEVLAWAASIDAFGWVVRYKGSVIMLPQACSFVHIPITNYTRAQIDTLNDDGTRGTWEAFEVPAK